MIRKDGYDRDGREGRVGRVLEAGGARVGRVGEGLLDLLHLLREALDALAKPVLCEGADLLAHVLRLVVGLLVLVHRVVQVVAHSGVFPSHVTSFLNPRPPQDGASRLPSASDCKELSVVVEGWRPPCHAAGSTRSIVIPRSGSAAARLACSLTESYRKRQSSRSNGMSISFGSAGTGGRELSHR